MINLVIVGVGQWGTRYVSTITENFSEISLITATRSTWKSLLDSKPDGVIISTHPDSHIEIAKYALDKSIPVMIEKPLAFSLQEVERLEGYSAPILVNYQHLHASAFVKLLEIISHWNRIDRITTRGYGNGPIRAYSSLFDYGSHDLSMCYALAQGQTQIEFIAQTPCWHSQGNIFDLRLNIGGIRVDSQLGNGAQNKQRYFEILGAEEIVVYDDMSENKLLHNGQIVKLTDRTPPLTASINTFLRLINGEKDWRSGLSLSKMVVGTLEQVDLALHGEAKRTRLSIGDE
jgi:predicted dehydrogenase